MLSSLARAPRAWALLASLTIGCTVESQADRPTPWAPQLDATPTTGFASTIPAPDGRPLSLEDYYGWPTVARAAISPDGAWVSFGVATAVEETNTTTTEVWLVPADGSAPASRVSREGEDARPAGWAEGRLVYAVGRDRWSVLPGDPEGGRTPAEPPAEGLVSPDGRVAAVVRDTPPDPPAPRETSDFERRHLERFEGQTWDWMYFQRDGRRTPVPDPRDPVAVPPREIFLTSLAEDGEAQELQLTHLGLRPGGLDWHPDSRSLVFTADSAYRDEMTYGRTDLWRVDLDGTLTRLTPADGYSNGSPAHSPDGRWLAFTRRFGTDKVIAERLDQGGPTDLYVLPTAGGEMVNLTADWDLQAGRPRWSPDGAWIYFTAGIGGATHLFRVSPEGGAVEQVTHGERRIVGLTFNETFETMAYLVGRLDAPPEVHVANIDGSGERRLTGVSDAMTSEIAFSRAERLVYPSADGTLVEGWLLYPYDYAPDGGPYPLIVHSHGGPHSASGYTMNFKHQLFAAHGYFVLQTNFRSSTGYGEDFLWATWGAWGDRDGEDVIAGVDFVLEHFPIDPGRVATIGHSYGGFMSNWLITRYPDRFAAAAVGAGISNWMSDYGTADIARTKETEFYGTPWTDEGRARLIRQSPLIHADGVRAATLFLHGEVDHRVPFEEAEQMYFAIKKQGVPAKMIRYAGQSHGGWGHWNNVHRMMQELAWFDEWLGR